MIDEAKHDARPFTVLREGNLAHYKTHTGALIPIKITHLILVGTSVRFRAKITADRARWGYPKGGELESWTGWLVGRNDLRKTRPVYFQIALSPTSAPLFDSNGGLHA
jgi:hypothetical protein